MSPTIKDNIQAKISKVQKWKEANPGQEWWTPPEPQTEPKIYISKEMVNSPAYRSLSRKSLLVYQDILMKGRREPVKRKEKIVAWKWANNGEIVLTYDEEEAKGISREQMRDAIDELQGKGFIDITYLSKRRGKGDATTYWIDNRWKTYGTNDFTPARNPRIKDTRKDRGWTRYNAKKKTNYSGKNHTEKTSIQWEKSH